MGTFAAGLKNGGDAMRAAPTTPGSNGQAEGHANQLKRVKRQMHGNAHFDLPRRRVPLAA